MSTPTVPPPAPKSKVIRLPQTLESAKRALNAEFCFIERLPGIAVFPTIEDPEFHVYSRGEFVQSVCSNRIINGTNVASEWMKWSGRQRALRITYAPGKPPLFDNMLNTWVGTRIVPKAGDLSLWLKYLDHIFSSDPENREWFTQWLAYQFQHPGIKLHSAVVFWSRETSTGKSLFGYIMAELFGHHNFSEIGEADLHGNFNFWAARKQFVMGEEIKGANAQRHADAMKSLITRKFITINTKNTPHYILPDCINYFFTSNHGEAFYLDETDRRFFVHRLNDKKLSADYVKNTFIPWLESGGYSAILHWLLNVDVSQFNPFSPPPQTTARKAMIEASRDDIDVWMDGICRSESTFLGTPGWELATAEDLFKCFLSEYPKSHIAYRSFVSRLRKDLPMVRGGNVVPLNDTDIPKRMYCPPLRIRVYDGVDLESLITSYWVGREE